MVAAKSLEAAQAIEQAQEQALEGVHDLDLVVDLEVEALTQDAPAQESFMGESDPV
jgi:hypothetical protein